MSFGHVLNVSSHDLCRWADFSAWITLNINRKKSDVVYRLCGVILLFINLITSTRRRSINYTKLASTKLKAVFNLKKNESHWWQRRENNGNQMNPCSWVRSSSTSSVSSAFSVDSASEWSVLVFRSALWKGFRPWIVAAICEKTVWVVTAVSGFTITVVEIVLHLQQLIIF